MRNNAEVSVKENNVRTVKRNKKFKIFAIRTGVSGVSAGNPCSIPACPLSA
jgi:hypothetical protein